MSRHELPTASTPVYYVYMLLDPRHPGEWTYGKYKFKFKPLYCGMGYNGRAHAHVKHAVKGVSMSQKDIKIRNIVKSTGSPPLVRFMKRDLIQQEAFDLERKLVCLIGRLQLKTGPLTNRSDGGEGQKNVVHTPEYRARRSAQNIAMWAGRTEEEIGALVATRLATCAKWSPEQRLGYAKKLSESHLKYNASLTPEQRKIKGIAYTATCAARTAKERAELSAKLSGSRKRFFDGLSEVDYLEFHAQVAEARSVTWNALSDREQKRTIAKRSLGIQQHWDGMSKKARREFSATVSSALQELPEEVKARRNSNISTGLVEYKCGLTKRERKAKGQAISEGHALRTPKEKKVFYAKCVSSNRSGDSEVRSKMSQSGLARVANMSDKERHRQSKALSTALTAMHSKLTSEERSERIRKGHLSRDKEAQAAKTSVSVSEVHANRTDKQRKAIADKIAQTLLSKSPADKQRQACGNTMRAMMKRHGLDLHHPTLRPQLDRLILGFAFDGTDLAKARFDRKVILSISRFG